ncbi:MAG: hypothetical protein ACXABY_04310 [Candidatus Thorarchaeota archaeon]|jgi:hypothetical protein
MTVKYAIYNKDTDPNLFSRLFDSAEEATEYRDTCDHKAIVVTIFIDDKPKRFVVKVAWVAYETFEIEANSKNEAEQQILGNPLTPVFGDPFVLHAEEVKG